MAAARYYGELIHHRVAGPFVVTVSAFYGGVTLPTHSHDFPYFTFTLRGSYNERYGTQSRFCTPGTAVAHPPFEAHSQQFAGEALLLRVALNENEPEGTVQAVFEQPRSLKNPSITSAVLRMHSELGHTDQSSNMIVEGLGYELLGHALRSTCLHCGSRRRALCAQMFIRSSLRHPISLAAISNAIGVSRATIYRDFKSTFGCAPGDYLRQARLGAAAAMLRTSARPVVEIAAECGFYDQSHFDRCFRLSSGVSPSQYRQLGLSRRLTP